MNVDRLLRQQAQLHRRRQDGPADEFGDPTWNVEVVDILPGCYLQPATGEELDERTDGRAEYIAWLPPGLHVAPSDRIVLAVGIEGEVIGAPRRWIDPRSQRESHVEVDLAEVDAFTGGG